MVTCVGCIQSKSLSLVNSTAPVALAVAAIQRSLSPVEFPVSWPAGIVTRVPLVLFPLFVVLGKLLLFPFLAAGVEDALEQVGARL